MALRVTRPGMTNGSACAWVRGAGMTKGKACRRCEYGWTGPRCTVDALPACRARDGSVDSCVVRKVLDCECVRQCLAAGAFPLHMREPFQAPLCTVPAPSGPPSFYGWSLNAAGGFTAGAATAVGKSSRPRLQFSPARQRQHDVDYEGSMCFNNCSFPRGACLRGGCACKPRYHGAGCAFPKDHLPRDGLAQDDALFGSSLRVYVYDLPPVVTGRRSWASDWDRQQLFWTAQRFVSALLADRATLTADPEGAHLYVVPYAATNMEGLTQYYEHLRDYISAEQPYFRRRGGKDHVWLCSADHGGDIMQGIRGVRSGIVLAHYFKGVYVARLAPQPVVLAPYLLGATDAAREIYPSWARDLSSSSPERFAEASGREDARRTTTFFFAGNLLLADKVGTYSEGVRQALWHHHHNRSGFKVVSQSATYKSDYLTSQFCAAPLGEGWGIRLTWAIAHGCIPVLFASEVRRFWSGPHTRAGVGGPEGRVSSGLHPVPELFYDEFSVVVEKVYATPKASER